jgi:hypothetical protein
MKSPTNLSRLGNDRSVAVERTGETGHEQPMNCEDATASTNQKRSVRQG